MRDYPVKATLKNPVKKIRSWVWVQLLFSELYAPTRRLFAPIVAHDWGIA
jgi:hypothetical protein